MPTVSVIMPVYNAGRYLAEAVDSILGQSFGDFELIAIDDASSDDSLAILRRYDDPRVRIEHHKANKGLATTLNDGLAMARGEFVARMDNDDVADSRRFDVQVAFLREHPDIGVVGSWVRSFGVSTSVQKYPLHHDEIVASFMFGNVICHPSVMFRRSLAAGDGFRYDPAFDYAEDYEFWTRMAGATRFANIGTPLLNYRTHPGQMTSKSMDIHKSVATKVFPRMLAMLHIEPSEVELEAHCAIAFHRGGVNIGQLDSTERWLLRLLAANREVCAFEQAAFERVIERRWFESCAAGRRAGVPVLGRFWRSQLSCLRGTASRIRRYAELASRRKR